MQRFLSHLAMTTERFTAIATWLVVAATALYYMTVYGDFSGAHIATAVGLYAAFIVCWLVSTYDDELVWLPSAVSDTGARIALLVLEFLIIIALYFTVPYGYTAILCVIWSAQLPYFFSMRTSLLLSPIWSVPLWLIYGFHWDYDQAHTTALLFWTFNLFALVTINTALKEQHAREAANQLNRELLATQALLQQATRQAERVRIARNIHDLLGHHLTALTIKLQVAERMSDGDARQHISECHGLAKLLLSDVREAVSEIRDRSDLDLEQALHALLDNIDELNVQLHLDTQLKVHDVSVAETLLRCVQESLTNSMKHAYASQFDVHIQQQAGQLKCTMQDNGSPDPDFRPGNGLMGMQERVKQLGGQVDFKASKAGFFTTINLPESI